MTTKPLLKAVIWDCDGVLVDSEILAMRIAGEIIYDELTRLAEGGVAEAATHLNGQPRDAFAKAIIAQYSGAHFSQMLTPHGITDPAEHQRLDDIKMVQTIDSLSREVETFEGLRDAMEEHKKMELGVAVSTSSELSRVLPCLKRHDLTAFFAGHIYSAVDSLPVKTPKPKPDIYLHAQRMLGVTGAESVAVEDSKSGVGSARAAGMEVIGFVGGKHIEDKAAHAEMLKANGAYTVIDNYADMTKALQQKFRFG